MHQFNLLPERENGESLESFMTRCALVYSSITALMSAAGALYFQANVLAIWGFLTVPVLLFLLLMYAIRQGDGHPENGLG